MLDPKVTQALLANTPELAEFRKFLGEELLLLDSLEGLDKLGKADRELEVAGRLRSMKYLRKIFDALIHTDPLTGSSMASDYAID